MNTKIRFLSEGNEVKKSSFPHRTFHKDSLHVGSKLIPVHNIDVNRGYRGKSMDNTHFEKWAFIPFNKKHTMKKKENTCCRSY